MNMKVATLLSIMLIFTSCSNPLSSNQSAPSPTPSISPTLQPTKEPTAEPTETIDPLKEKIAGLTLDEKIGQMVIVGLEGTTMQEQAKEMIDKYEVGGFILYKDNIIDADQTLKLLNQLKASNQMNDIPLWLSIDQEGGKVSRLPDEFTKIPSTADVGKANNTSYTSHIGQAIGEAVHALGFNMDFAPVLDINSNPKNPVIGNRAFGATPELVITHGIETMKAIQSKQVAAVVKHFPGHGDTSVDSHLDLPVVNKSLKELEAFELLPFAEAIQENADAIMIAHLLIPKIDENYPASLSKELITDLLREKLNYNGVVMTDDMTMGGITEHYDVGEAAVMSVLAGSDIILIGHDYDTQISVLKALKENARDGVITKNQLDQSVYRILSLKAKYALEDKAVPSVDIEAVNHQIRSALQAKK
ncbi:glycoside hydrolase family 3 [Paenibacillus sp. FSL H8-0548]|uniref:beta-N-acetylhexosaminidase n=1 Tax=Paenibacillus sp. FSL H8-0548 TaxID=1920422 RepID=UPI00096EBAD3|nr:beta-N-acetylhexosaminidase [Paenibacillus sp. FSL H8-0548]OMF21455.1 glycoside hydrolase family 3 [Paenibacillus sp. FSL H8-0548]